METVLLHSCCAPCSAAILEWMLAHEFEPVLYFFNPNIYPKEEYEKRKSELVCHAQRLGVRIVDDDWNHDAWLEAVKGLEMEPERGARCQICFNLRLMQTAQKCKELGISKFTTSLASSRWKSLTQVDAAGFAAAKACGVTYWAKNWRKDGLQERRSILLKEYGFYNQQWCGCEFSKRDADKARRAKEALQQESEKFEPSRVNASPKEAPTS